MITNPLLNEEPHAITGLAKLQALYRGNRARKSYVPRLLAGEKFVCPFVSCEDDIILQVLEIIRNFKLSGQYTLIDLGSGDGKVLIEVAKTPTLFALGMKLMKLNATRQIGS